jgi:transposase
MIGTLDVRRLKFVDESGVNLAMTRLYGRAPKGERVVGSVPQNYGQNVTVLAALGPQGLHAMMTVEGATDAEVFRAYVKYVLGPTLASGDIVVLDNLRAHKAVGIQQMLARRRVRLLYLPPYSPDLAPIEPSWAKVKTALRKAKARTRAALDGAIAEALLTITETDARGWFLHCGYALQWYENRSRIENGGMSDGMRRNHGTIVETGQAIPIQEIREESHTRPHEIARELCLTSCHSG